MRKLDEFTNDEVKHIDEIYAKKLEGLTPEEVRLLSDWETALAFETETHKAETEAAKALAEEQLKNSKSVADKAKRTLAAIEKEAIARLERVSLND